MKDIVLLVLGLAGNSQGVARQSVEEATDSIKNILSLARGGDAAAQNEVGNWYYLGRHTDRNYDEAAQWWARSAAQGNVTAIGNLGLCYQYGYGVEADSLKATQLYLRSIKEGNLDLFGRQEDLAREGSVFSDMLVAACYRTGTGVRKNPDKAIPFLEDAASRGCVEAKMDLGMLYINSKRPEEAYRWFKEGAADENLTCMYYTAEMQIEGNGTEKNEKKGAEEMLAAARKGFPMAMYYVGKCYFDGIGMDADPAEGLKWYKLGAARNALKAQWNLAQCLREGKVGPVAYDQAIYWYGVAVSKGYRKSFQRLVCDSIPDSPFVAYLRGMKALQTDNFSDALKCFQAVSKAGVPAGKVMEAAVLLDPDNKARDEKKGLKILKKAAEKDPTGMMMLGLFYQEGKFVKESPEEALKYFEEAARLSYPPALCLLGDMYFSGEGVKADVAKAVDYYAQAYACGQLTASAAANYSSCFEEGLGGLTPDPKMAEEIRSASRDPEIQTLFQLLPE